MQLDISQPPRRKTLLREARTGEAVASHGEGMFISIEGMLGGEMMLLGEVCFSPGHELLQKSKTKFGAMEEPTAQTGSYSGTNVLIPLEDPS